MRMSREEIAGASRRGAKGCEQRSSEISETPCEFVLPTNSSERKLERSSGVWAAFMGDTSCGGAAPKESFGATQNRLFGVTQTGHSGPRSKIIRGHSCKALQELPFASFAPLRENLFLPFQLGR